MQDKLFRVLLILSAIIIPVIGGGIVYSLTIDSAGAFKEFGFWNFVFSDDWVTTAGKESYGALPFITGTLLTTFLALIMCIPFSLPVALFTGEYFRGKKIATILGTVTDLLAGILLLFMVCGGSMYCVMCLCILTCRHRVREF